MGSLAVATWNICHGSLPGGAGAGSDVLAQAVVSLGADVVALQEVERHSPRSGSVDQIATVAAALGMDHSFARTTGVGGTGDYGIAAFANAIVAADVMRLSCAEGVEPRAVIDVRLDTVLGALRVIATHLSRDPRDRGVQLGELVALVAQSDGPLVVMGDFNTRPEEALALFERSGLTVAATGPTFLGDRRVPSTVRIDYIAVRALAVLRTEVVALPLSDHAAVRATLVAAPASA